MSHEIIISLFTFFNSLYFSFGWLIALFSDLNFHKSARWHCSVLYVLIWNKRESRQRLSYLRINRNVIGEKGLLTLIKNLDGWIALSEIQYKRRMKEFGPGLSFKYFITELMGSLQNQAAWMVAQRITISTWGEWEMKCKGTVIFSSISFFLQFISTFLLETQGKAHR